MCRHVLNTVRNAVGRSGEARFFKLEDGDFNQDDQVFQSVWFQRKSKRIQVMAFAHDHEWQLDFHTTFAGYLITNRDEVLNTADPTDGTHWMFPHLAAMKNVESVNQYVTDTLRSCVGHVRGVDEKTASHNIRYGAMDDLNACMLLDVVACLQRGDWYFTGDSAGFHYLMSLRNDLMASRALAGHVEPTAKVFLPDFTRVASELGEDIIAKLESISSHLFACLPFSDNPTDRLFHYRKILLSVIIVALPQIKEALGKDSSLVLTVTGEAARNSLHWKDLMSIRDLMLDNVKALNKIELVNVRTATQQELQDLQEEVKDLRNEIQVQSKGIADLSSKVDKLTDLLSNVLDSNPSPQVPPSRHIEFHQPLAVSPAVSQEEREESPVVRKSRKSSSDIISDKELPAKKLKVAKQQISITEMLSAGQSVKFSPKCFTNFTSMTISTVVMEVLLQDVDVKEKNPVDNITGNDQGRMKRLFRFIALFCNEKEYNLFIGRNRPFINRSNKAEFEQKKKEYNEIASSLEKRVVKYMNGALNRVFDSKTFKVSTFRRIMEEKRNNIDLKEHAENWETKTSEESESKVVQEAKNDKMKEELSKSTPKDLLSKLFELQQSRVEVYKQFNSGLENVLQSGNLTTYPDLTANITASFSVISNSIRCIIEIMQSQTDGSRSKEFQLEEVDLSTLSNCIKFTKQLQNLEKEKLNYTAALHLEKIRERNERLNIEARESGDEKVLNLLQQGVKGLQSKISGCIEQINETLEELRYASLDLQG